MSIDNPQDVPSFYDASQDDRITPEMRESADAYTLEAMQSVREQLHNTFSVAIEACTTLEELFKLQEFSIALNGLLRLAKKGSNG